MVFEPGIFSSEGLGAMFIFTKIFRYLTSMFLATVSSPIASTMTPSKYDFASVDRTM